MKEMDLINRFKPITERYNAIREDCQKYIIGDMRKCIKRVYTAKLNGFTQKEFAKWRETSYESTDDYFAHVEGFETYLFENVKAEVTVGTPCTIILYSDRYGGAVTSLKKNKKGKVVEVEVSRYEYEVESPYEGECKMLDTFEKGVEIFTLRRNGGWYAQAQPKQFGSVKLAMGYARTYRDPSF